MSLMEDHRTGSVASEHTEGEEYEDNNEVDDPTQGEYEEGAFDDGEFALIFVGFSLN
jgi:hypothetical protein